MAEAVGRGDAEKIEKNCDFDLTKAKSMLNYIFMLRRLSWESSGGAVLKKV